MVSYGLPLSEVCLMFCISLQRNFSVYLQATWVRNVNLSYVNFHLESDGIQTCIPWCKAISIVAHKTYQSMVNIKKVIIK